MNTVDISRQTELYSLFLQKRPVVFCANVVDNVGENSYVLLRDKNWKMLDKENPSRKQASAFID